MIVGWPVVAVARIDSDNLVAHMEKSPDEAVVCELRQGRTRLRRDLGIVASGFLGHADDR
jgi:hypothetical protein